MHTLLVTENEIQCQSGVGLRDQNRLQYKCEDFRNTPFCNHDGMACCKEFMYGSQDLCSRCQCHLDGKRRLEIDQGKLNDLQKSICTKTLFIGLFKLFL